MQFSRTYAVTLAVRQYILGPLHNVTRVYPALQQVRRICTGSQQLAYERDGLLTHRMTISNIAEENSVKWIRLIALGGEERGGHSVSCIIPYSG